MKTENISDYHIAVGEGVDGGLVLAYLVEDNVFEGDITLSLEENDITLTADNICHKLIGASDEIINTVMVHRLFKVINVNTDLVYDVTVEQ